MKVTHFPANKTREGVSCKWGPDWGGWWKRMLQRNFSVLLRKPNDCITPFSLLCTQGMAGTLLWKAEILFCQQRLSSVAHSCPTLCDLVDCSTEGFPVHYQYPRACSISCPFSKWCHPTISTSVIPFSSHLSQHQGLSNESVLRIRWPKYGSFSLSISPSNEYSGLISFRMDWLDLLAVQGTLKSLLQYHSSNASILRRSAFFTVQLSHPYMTTGKTIALTRWTFVGKVISLLFNMLSRLVITFLPRSKRLLISWLQSPSAVILEPRKIKVWHCFHCVPIYFPWSDRTGCPDLRFLNVEL